MSVVEKIKQKAHSEKEICTTLGIPDGAKKILLTHKRWIKVSDVLKILSEQQQKLQQFQSWLEEREQKTRTKFDKKGWGDTKLEITVVKEKFVEVFES